MICFTYQWKFIKTSCWNIILPWKTHSTSPVFAPSAKRHLAPKGAELDKHQQKNQECLWINPLGSKKAPKTPIFFYWWCLFVCCSIHGDIFMIFGPEACKPLPLAVLLLSRTLKLEGMNSGKWIQIPGWTWAQQMLKKKRCSFPIPFSKRDRNVSTGIRKNLPKGLVKCSCLLPANPFYSSACWEPQKMETCRCGGGGTSLATLPSNSQRLAMTSLCDKGEKLVTRKSSTKNDWNQQQSIRSLSTGQI